MTKNEKRAAAGVGILALIGAALFAKGAKADENGFKVTPATPGGGPKPDGPKGPGSFDDPACPPGQIWSEADGACVPNFKVTPAEPGEDPTVVINRYLLPHPPNRTGGLYQIRWNDNPTKIAKAAIEGEFGPVNESGIYTPTYVALMSTHSWNIGLYSCIWTPDDPDAFDAPSRKGKSGKPKRSVRQRYTGEEHDSQGVWRRWYIGDAFFTKHKPNLERLRGGNIPLRNTDAHGNLGEGGNSYGLLWLPKIVEFGEQNHLVIDSGIPDDLAALAPNIYG